MQYKLSDNERIAIMFDSGHSREMLHTQSEGVFYKETLEVLAKNYFYGNLKQMWTLDKAKEIIDNNFLSNESKDYLADYFSKMILFGEERLIPTNMPIKAEEMAKDISNYLRDRPYAMLKFYKGQKWS